MSPPPKTPPPAITPEKVPEALVSVSVWPPLPSETPPAPVRVMIDAPPIVPEMSNVPLSMTLAESAIEPVPFSRKAAPVSIVVTPA